MASQEHDTVDVNDVLQLREVWSNGTQTGDPPAGYTATNGAGHVIRQRPLTADETARLAALDVTNTADTNQATIHSRLSAAVTANNAYLALNTPTAAQTAAQVARVTRECTAFAKLLLNQLADTSGT